ncbi:MAG: radical SAM protein [Verrucomicrobia bacterium]|nr:radical SAM protein [Verrucomicrobiota bacterium]
MALLNIADYVECTESEGPGRRFALWLQGCPIRCPGCCNEHLFGYEPKLVLTPEEFFVRVRSAQQAHNLEGITALGGEPLIQAKGLSILARLCREDRLSVMIFTGFTLEYLERSELPGTADLLKHCDLLVDGPFRQDLPETNRNWVGSSNQRFHYLSDRYSSEIETDPAYANRIEFRIHKGKIKIHGFPFESDLRGISATTARPVSEPVPACNNCSR